MDKHTRSDSLRALRGEAVAPLAALTGIPMALAGRSVPPVPGVSPLSARSVRFLPAGEAASRIGSPEAPSAGVSGSEGAAPPSAGAGDAGAPNLDTSETIRISEPSRSALFGAVWMTPDEHAEGVAHELRRLAIYHVVHGKRRRDFVKKARALLTCGMYARVRRCGSCGSVDAQSAVIECGCGLRSCPRCSRRRADILRRRLDDKWLAGEHPRDMGLYFLTFTLPYDPGSSDDLSIEGLKRRKKIVREAVSFVWKRYLKPRGRALALALEVSPRGAVHVHSLFHGRRPDVRQLRDVYMFKAGNAPFVNSQHVRKPAKAIRELAKYMLKAASPKNPRIFRGGRGEFLDPVLAARAEVAFSGERLFESFGAWRGADEDEDIPERAPHTCAHCGADRWVDETVRVVVLLPELPRDWVPRFGRAGPRAALPESRGAAA
jgi:hypothetical protein